MEGMLHADGINTVSPQYAKEILTGEFGQHLETVIADHHLTIHGILNGLNTADFDPQTDRHLFQNYHSASFAVGKSANKLGLQAELGLAQGANYLVISYIGRVDANQKGIQLIIEAIRRRQLPSSDQQFIFLGTGDQKLERELHELTDRQFNLRVVTRYDDQLARRIYAASDLLIIPSKFEPCGLIQMIANRYGALPVARATGGLVDTIKDGLNGFLFPDYTCDSMLAALDRAVKAVKNVSQAKTMIQTAMSLDFSWDQAAAKYHRLYQQIINQPNNQG
jgi:starch synthase